RRARADHLRAADLSEKPVSEENPSQARQVQERRDRYAGRADAETRHLEKAERKGEKVGGDSAEENMRIVIGILVGLFVAWNIKQPEVLKQLQDWGLYNFYEYVDQLCKQYKKPEAPKENN